jgi:hypothetical protein
MERYYEDLEKRFEDRELILESILYEADLYATFGPAIEADATVASPSDGSSNSSGSTSGSTTTNSNSTGNSAVDTLHNAGNTIENSNDDAKTEADKSKDQSLNNMASKAKQELSSSIREIIEAVTEFVQKYLVEFRSSMSTMLNDNADVVAELNKLTKGKTPNYNITVKDYLYNNDVIANTSNALEKAFDEYTKTARYINDATKELDNILREGDDEKKDQEIAKILSMIKESDGNEHLNITTTANTASDAGVAKLERPHTMVAKILGVKNGDISLGELRKYIHSQYKGLREGQNEAPTINLANNHQIVQNAERFLMDFKTYLRGISNSSDKLRNNAENYKDICETGKNLPLVDDKIKSAYTSLMNGMASDLNEFVSLSEFLITILKERALASEILIRKVYGVNPIPAKDRGNKNQPVKNNKAR